MVSSVVTGYKAVHSQVYSCTLYDRQACIYCVNCWCIWVII